jgi:hypothetical protein
MSKEIVRNPVFGQVYMASRYHNSKRIVLEPFRLQGANPPNPQMVLQYKYAGEWVMDGKKANVSSLYPPDPKWVKRKLAELNDEVLALNLKMLNLANISA